jgi:hypothetical protein
MVVAECATVKPTIRLALTVRRRAPMVARMSTPFAEMIAASLQRERFTLVDVGCSGGLESAWRVFGDRLRALGFDASISECQRLIEAETNPDIEYLAGFVDVPPDHAFAGQIKDGPDFSGNPFSRLSVAWALELRAEKLKVASADEKRTHNVWAMTELADPAKRVFVPATLRERGYDDIDLLKIDIDGADFRVLNSFDGLFDEFRVSAVRLEVNFFGGPEETLHTFHNTDKFMRKQGFDLFLLENRHYSARALPAKFDITSPAQTVTGRVFQGDAYYARDACRDDRRDPMAGYGPEKIAKLAAIFSIWNQPDGAAELLVNFRERLAPLMDVNRGLDLLAAQTQPNVEKPLSYADYMALFASDSSLFYRQPPPPPPPPPTLRDRLRAARRAYDDPYNAFPPKKWE